jgi:hypothetical protein
MLTFTQAYTRAANMCGVPLTAPDVTFIKQDINQAERLFKNAARRYWTRLEKATALVALQQYYQLPPDLIRVTEVRINSNGMNFPLILIHSEHLWNKLNIIPAMTINLPTYGFVRGRNELGLWPMPATTVSNGLMVSYEPRLTDMTVDDVTTATNSTLGTVTATTTNGSNVITLSSAIVTQNMVGRWFTVNDGSDGNWYQITTYNSSTSFNVDNDYAGLSSSTAQFIIGQASQLPEDYMMALPYYASYNFYLKRKDLETAGFHKQEFMMLLDMYKKAYADKQTGVVTNQVNDYRYSLFSLPPSPIV